MTLNCWLPEGSRLPRAVPRQPALFLDRDGVLVEDIHFLKTRADVRLIEDSIAPLRRLQERYVLVIASNQSGVARGLFDELAVDDINRHIADRFADHGVQLDGFYYCPHHPDGAVAFYRQNCACRKPAPGMLLRASEDWGLDLAASYMVGDRSTDLQAGRAAGAHGFLLTSDSRAEAWARLATLVSREFERTFA